MIWRLVSALALGIIGWRMSLMGSSLHTAMEDFTPWRLIITLASGLIGVLAGPYITYKPARSAMDQFNQIPSSVVIPGTVGLITGLIVAVLISIPFFQLSGWVSWGMPIIISSILGLLGLSVGIHRDEDFKTLFPSSVGQSLGRRKNSSPILIDTSAIIDGRIADLFKTKFIQGKMVIPGFVLEELQHIADSSDSLKRTRGRRGLDVLTQLRREGDPPIHFLDAKLTQGGEVDAELVRLAKDMKGLILTTDFNLNRVAELQGVNVLNVNDLANAIKPVVLPGEEITVNIIKEGKEASQGIAFLDDGTMIVVEGGRRYINTAQDVTISRVLQTPAGRIIFSELRGF